MTKSFSKPVFIVIAIILLGLVGYSLLKVFGGLPSGAPDPSPVLKEEKTIGVLYFRQQSEVIEGLKQGMKDLGYENIVYEERVNSTGPTLLAEVKSTSEELVAANVDLIFSGLEHQARGALKATADANSTIPIVYTTSFHDPVKYGLAESYRSSGNNSTGVSLNIVEVVQKQLEFLKKADPDSRKIGMFGDGFQVPAIGEEFAAELRVQAPRFGYEVVEYSTSVPPPEAEAAWHETANAIEAGEIDSIYHIAGHYFEPQEGAEFKLAERLGVLMLAPLEDLPNGGHFGYSSDFFESGIQAARLIDKIFRGADPSDIPIEFTKENILVINTTRADKIGFTFPEDMLSIAEIITYD
jgi:putative tryptophan/tyrosine transport system substrate-binding protein